MNQAFSQEALGLENQDEILVRKKLEDLKVVAKKLEKKYQGKEGVKRLRKDTEDKIHSEIQIIREYSEATGNESVLQVLKGYERNIVREIVNGEVVTRFKTLDELKKEAAKSQELLFKKDPRKKVYSQKIIKDEEREVEKTSSVNGVGFDYKSALVEEETIQLKDGFNYFEKEERPLPVSKEEKNVSGLMIYPVVIFVVGLILWKKFFKK